MIGQIFTLLLAIIEDKLSATPAHQSLTEFASQTEGAFIQNLSGDVNYFNEILVMCVMPEAVNTEVEVDLYSRRSQLSVHHVR